MRHRRVGAFIPSADPRLLPRARPLPIDRRSLQTRNAYRWIGHTFRRDRLASERLGKRRLCRRVDGPHIGAVSLPVSFAISGRCCRFSLSAARRMRLTVSCSTRKSLALLTPKARRGFLLSFALSGLCQRPSLVGPNRRAQEGERAQESVNGLASCSELGFDLCEIECTWPRHVEITHHPI